MYFIKHMFLNCVLDTCNKELTSGDEFNIKNEKFSASGDFGGAYRPHKARLG